jgi:hypothetical protein
MASVRNYHTSILLPTGKVLVAGGNTGVGIIAGAELYDPNTGNWTTTGNMGSARYVHAATMLPNGKVLLVGGNSTLTTVVASCELYW